MNLGRLSDLQDSLDAIYSDLLNEISNTEQEFIDKLQELRQSSLPDGVKQQKIAQLQDLQNKIMDLLEQAEDDDGIELDDLDFWYDEYDVLNAAMHMVLGDNYNQESYNELMSSHNEVVITSMELRAKRADVNDAANEYLQKMN